MKKITMIAALLGSAYFANAQVGIGTPAPDSSAMLDITAENKGVLIPRVALDNETSYLKNTTDDTTITPVQSLLVYATGKKIENKLFVDGGLEAGFYYWNVNKWERIVSQTDLTNAIEEANAELDDIISLLQTAYPSNNLDGSTTTGSALGGGMVYTPASGTTPAKIEYVYYNGTQYVKQDLSGMLADIIDPANGSVFYNNIGTETAPEFVFQYWDASLNNGEGGFTTITISDLVQANETKTKIQTIEGKQFYFAENFEGVIPTSIPASLPTGMYLIDVVGGVVNNIEEIFTTNTTIVINEGGTNEQTFTTVQEYIEYISQNADLKDGVMTFVPGTGATLAEQLASSSFTYNVTDAQGNTTTQVVNFGSLVKANQSLTNIATTNPSANVINYVYTAEPNLDGTARVFTIDLTQDLINQITNNGDVKNAITNVVNGNGGVFYNGTGGNLVVGNATIPAGSLYTMDADGNGVLIDLGSIVVSEVIENFNTIVNSPVTVNNIQYDSVEEYIQYIAETSDANVGFTTTEITAANNPGGLLIPANSIYYINSNGVKVAIPLGDIVFQGITQLTDIQVNDVKTKLGDNISTTEILTGDKYDNKPVYKKVLNTTVAAGTAVANQVALAGATKIISVHVFYSSANRKGNTASITDVILSGGNLNFNIGTGNMYQVLDSAASTTLEVIVEYIK